jgi:hypothetical protein
MRDNLRFGWIVLESWQEIARKTHEYPTPHP